MQNIIYERQKTLELYVPNRVLVIGVGGIGSWCSLNLSLVGVGHLTLVDPDKIEPHNLNRTPFKLTHIGKYKVEAMSELILERRPDADITPIPTKIEDALQLINVDSYNFIIDCRDKLEPIKVNKNYIKLGYDGKNITIHINPSPTAPVWGEGGDGYRVVPSYLVPPQLLANIVTELITSKSEFLNRKDLIINITMEEIIGKIFSS
jgi:hypothetical protein